MSDLLNIRLFLKVNLVLLRSTDNRNLIDEPEKTQGLLSISQRVLRQCQIQQSKSEQR